MREPVPFDVLLKQVDRADTRVICGVVEDSAKMDSRDSEEEPLPEKRPMKPAVMHPGESSGWVRDRTTLTWCCWCLLLLLIAGALAWGFFHDGG